jgi:hypothetical protein
LALVAALVATAEVWALVATAGVLVLVVDEGRTFILAHLALLHLETPKW